MRQHILGPDDSRAPVRRSRHGLRPDEIDALYALQDGCCAICRQRRALSIDHDHAHCAGATGCPRCVRGALCVRCQKLMYLSDDSPVIARALVAYIERTGPR